MPDCDGQTDRQTDGFTIASTALTAMLTRCKNAVRSIAIGLDGHRVQQNIAYLVLEHFRRCCPFRDNANYVIINKLSVYYGFDTLM